MTQTDPVRLAREIDACLQQEDWHRALTLLGQWRGLQPKNAKGWFNTGYCLVRLGRLAEAARALERSLSFDPNQTNARQLLDHVRKLQGEPTDPDEDSAADVTLHSHTKTHADTEPGKTVPTEAPKDTKHSTRTARQGQMTFTRGSIGGATLPTHTGSRVWTVGSVIAGRYEVRSSAHGGMGVVHICYDRELGRTVAVKTPLPSVLASERGQARFLREAEAWIGLGMHPNICTAYYLEEIGSIPRIFIEYIDGGSLDQWLKEQRPLTLEQRLDIAIQIATGMHHTHSFTWSDEEGRQHTGLIHRDLKPANVLMGTDGTAHVTDFGLVRHTEVRHGDAQSESTGDSGSEMDLGQLVRQLDGTGVSSGSWQTVTAAGSLMGTPPYMAPELWLGTRGPSVASDVYAFGCIAWELICGRRPFQPADHDALSRESQIIGWMHAHTRGQPPDPMLLVPELDEEMARWLRTLIAKDPSRRPESFQMIRADGVRMYERLLGARYPRPMPRKSLLLADSLNNRGVSYMALGQEDRARRTWSDTLKLDPHHIEATYNLALLEWRTYGISDAEIVRRMRSLHPEHGTTWRDEHLLGKLLLFLGDYERAVACLRGIDDRSPLDVRRDLGLAQAAAARRTGSIELWSAAEETLETVHAEDEADLRVVAALAAARAARGAKASAHELWAGVRLRSADLPETVEEAVRRFVPGHDHLATVTTADAVTCLVYSADGRRLAARCGDKDLVVWRLSPTDPGSVTVEHTIRLDDSARRSRAVAITPDGERAILRAHDVPATVWELEHGQNERRLLGHSGYATAIAAATDNRLVLIGNTDRSVRLWDITTGQCLRPLGAHQTFVAAVDIASDGTVAISGGGDGIRVWDLRDGSDAVLEGHHGVVTAVALSPSAQWIASGGEDRTVRIWNRHTLEPSATITGHQAGIHEVVWSADESLLVTCAGDRTVRLWERSTGLPVRTLTFPEPVHDVALDWTRQTLAVAHGHRVDLLHFEAQTAYRVPFATTLPVSTADLERRDLEFRGHLETASAAISSEHWPAALEALRQARAVPGYQQDRKALKLWAHLLTVFPKRGLRSAAIYAALESTGHQIHAAAAARDPSQVLTAGSDGKIRSWDLRSRTCTQVLTGHEGAVLCLAQHRAGEHLLSGGRDGSVCLWDLQTGERTARLRCHDDAVRSVAFTACGTGCLSGASDGTVLVWEAAEPRPRLELEHGAPVTAVAASNDDRYVASAGADGSVHIWSLATARRVRTVTVASGAVTAIDFSPDCRRFATVGSDGRVCLWDLASGRLQRTLEGHDGEATTVGWSPDATYLLSGGRDGTMRVWDRRTNGCLRECTGHTDQLVTVQFSHDGRFAVSASRDGALRFWILDWEPEVNEDPAVWVDRARPFLEAFLHRQLGANAEPGAGPTWSDKDLDELLDDLRHRGFGRAERQQLERQLEQMLLQWSTRRAREELEDTRAQTITARTEVTQPIREVAERVGHNIGLKAAGAVLLLLVLVVLYQSLRIPESGELLYNDTIRQQLFQKYQLTSRSYKHDSVFTGMLSGGGPARAVGLAVACDPQQLDGYLEALQDPDWHTAPSHSSTAYDAAVSCVLQLAGPDHATILLEGVHSELRRIQRDDTVLLLVRLGDAVIPALETALAHQRAPPRHVAAKALVLQRTDRSLRALVDAINSDDPDANEAGSYVLKELIVSGRLGPEEAFLMIQRLASSIDPATRRNAIAALTMFEETRPVRQLLDTALEDPDPGVREAAKISRNTLRDAESQSIRELLFGR